MEFHTRSYDTSSAKEYGWYGFGWNFESELPSQRLLWRYWGPLLGAMAELYRLGWVPPGSAQVQVQGANLVG